MGCSYKFDANVSVAIWREFISRKAMGGPSSDSRGLTVSQHENLHLDDYRRGMGSGSLDAAYQSEGFATAADCEAQRQGFQAFIERHTDSVSNASGKRDAD